MIVYRSISDSRTTLEYARRRHRIVEICNSKNTPTAINSGGQAATISEIALNQLGSLVCKGFGGQ